MFSQFSVCVKVSININYSQVTIMGKAHLTYGRIYLYIYISDMVDSTCLSVSIIWKPWCDFLIHLICIIHIVSLLDSYLIFVNFFTRTHFKSWKFYTRKMRKFTTKLPKTVFFWFFWNFFTLSQNFYTHGVRSVRDKYQVCLDYDCA